MTPRIMVAPLDWGLGHATRCIPLIDALLARGAEVVLASSGQALELLSGHYPALEALELPAYNLRYSAKNSQSGAMLRQLLPIYRSIRSEHRWLRAYLQRHPLDALIADHRLGLWHPELHSILMAHQLAIQPPPGMAWLRPLLFQGQWHFVRRFDEIWVPDAPGKNELVGGLVPEKIRKLTKLRFMGPLSHLKGQAANLAEKIPLLVILSGLEPQRTLLEEKIRKQLRRLSQEAILVQGLPGKIRRQQKGTLTTISFLGSAELASLCRQAEVIVSRSGYSSLMDYAALGKQKLILIPTPGQTEQVYLAQRLAARKIALVQQQEQLDLQAALEQIDSFSGFPLKEDLSFLLNEGLNALFDRIISDNS